jgi:hypothetical protein
VIRAATAHELGLKYDRYRLTVKSSAVVRCWPYLWSERVLPVAAGRHLALLDIRLDGDEVCDGFDEVCDGFAGA